MRITHVAMDREDAVAALGRHWPPQPGATVARIGLTVDIAHGAVAVHDTHDQPGTTWWVVDGLIPDQDAGSAPVLPGCPLVTVEETAPASPPPTPALDPLVS